MGRLGGVGPSPFQRRSDPSSCVGETRTATTPPPRRHVQGERAGSDRMNTPAGPLGPGLGGGAVGTTQARTQFAVAFQRLTPLLSMTRPSSGHTVRNPTSSVSK